MLHLARRAVLITVLLSNSAAFAAETPPPDPATEFEKVPADQVLAVLSLAVKAQNGEAVGRIVDVLVDIAGQPRAAIVDVGGFMGVGSRKIAVEWKSLRFTLAPNLCATVALAPDKLAAAPAYDPAKPIELVVAAPPGVPTPAVPPTAP